MMEPSAHPPSPILSRRQFVHAAMALGSGLALSIELPAQEGRAAASPLRPPAAFLHIGEDNLITLTTPAVEMGQGGHTSITHDHHGGARGRLAAAARPGRARRGGLQQSQCSACSPPSAASRCAVGTTKHGASARPRGRCWCRRRRSTWSVPAHECTVARSVITHTASRRTRTFGSVAAQAARLPVPQQPVLKAVRKLHTDRHLTAAPGCAREGRRQCALRHRRAPAGHAVCGHQAAPSFSGKRARAR